MNPQIETIEPRRLLAANLVADFGGIYPTDSVTLNGISYFAADDGAHGKELWRSDGTPDGTVMVRDIVPGAQGSNAGSFDVVNGRVVFFTRAGDPSASENTVA